MTSLRVKPTTIRLVAHSLNQMRRRVPARMYYVYASDYPFSPLLVHPPPKLYPDVQCRRL